MSERIEHDGMTIRSDLQEFQRRAADDERGRIVAYLDRASREAERASKNEAEYARRHGLALVADILASYASAISEGAHRR